MGGPHVTPEMERLIIDTWLTMRTSEYDPTAKEVRYSVIRQLSQEGYSESDIPKLRTFQEYLRRARKQQIKLRGLPIDEQKPWTMATLNELELAPQSIPQVLQVWRYSVSLGAEFTVRQAKWASRLYSQISDTTELWIMSREYCREEELSLLTNAKFRTDRLDYFQAIGNWERCTILTTDGYNPEDSVGYIQPLLIPRGKDGGIAEELLHTLYFRPFDFPTELSDSEFTNKWELYHLITELPSSSLYFPDFETRMVYLRHLSYLSKGPDWERLSLEEIVSIIVELRNWINNLKSQIDELKALGKTCVRPNHTVSYMHHSFPRHLYGRAGYPYIEGGIK